MRSEFKKKKIIIASKPLCCPIAGGPLVYDSVQLVQNSAALNGTQRVLLDHVISEQECSDLRHLAHVRVSHDQKS